MLKPLELANANAVLIAEAKAEQEEKSRIIEAAERDADAIQASGQEIAEATVVENTSSPTPSDSPVTGGPTGAGNVAEDTAPVTSSNPASPAVDTPSPNYSVSASASNVGQHIDVKA